MNNHQVIEYALSLLPYEAVTVRTPQGFEYEGKRSLVKRICGVSILRAGETMEAALTEVCQNIRVGKILIQTSKDTGEPELYYLRLPKEIKDYRVILMDATVATGAAAMMAIRKVVEGCRGWPRWFDTVLFTVDFGVPPCHPHAVTILPLHPNERRKLSNHQSHPVINSLASVIHFPGDAQNCLEAHCISKD